MQQFRVDIHVHTVLSPCGSLEMSPAAIVDSASRKKIDVLGITDHNSTRHALLVSRMAEKAGIFVLCGAEVTTREEVHCLAFFETATQLDLFQHYLDAHLPAIANDVRLFGHQVVVNEQEEILEEVPYLLISALDQTFDQVQEKVHSLGGLFIPAHIDRPRFSLSSQLGFIPRGLKADALEISGNGSRDNILAMYPYLKDYTFVRSSDAHHPDQIGSCVSIFEMEQASFSEIVMALKNENQRKVISVVC